MIMNKADELQRFLFENQHMRGEFVRLDTSLRHATEQHNYPKVIYNLLGETLLAAVLLSATIKFEGMLTIQLQSENEINLLVAKCSHDFKVRGLIQWDKTLNENLLPETLGPGQLIITIQPDSNAQAYQGIVAIRNQQSITEAIEEYFAQSEQLPTKLWLEVGDGHAAGMLLQTLPGPNSQDREYFWEHATILGSTLTRQELLDLDNQTILQRLYPEESIRLFNADDVQFSCQCTIPRMENAIRIMGKAEALDILTTKQHLTVHCEYCNREYAFDRDAITNIFSASS